MVDCIDQVSRVVLNTTTRTGVHLLSGFVFRFEIGPQHAVDNDKATGARHRQMGNAKDLSQPNVASAAADDALMMTSTAAYRCAVFSDSAQPIGPFLPSVRRFRSRTS